MGHTEVSESRATALPQGLDRQANGQQVEIDGDFGLNGDGDRRAKSSSPLSQFDEDAKDQQQDDDGDQDMHLDLDMDMDMDMDDGDDDEILPDQTDRISESTIQPRVEEDDDDADERQSSVTSSTIPLTSLDDSPNHRQRGGAGQPSTQHGAVPRTLGIFSSSNLNLVDIAQGALGDSSTLASIVEAASALTREPASPQTRADDGSDILDDGSDLTETDGEDEEEDDEDEEDDDLEEEERGREEEEHERGA